MIAARWVHNTAEFIRKRVDALMAHNERLAPDKKLAPEELINLAQGEASVARIGLPGNSQRPWDGKHAESSGDLSDSDRRTVDRAIAKRARRAARAS